MSTTKKLIIAAAIILILLVFFTVLVGTITRQRVPSPTPTPIPAIDSSGGRGNFSQTVEALTPLEEQKRLAEARTISETLTSQEAEIFENLKALLPYESPEFDIVYSEGLDQFFIEKKSPDADEKLNRFFEERNALSFYRTRSNLFITTRNLRNSVTQDEEKHFKDNDTRLNDPIHIPPIEGGEEAAPTETSSEEIQPLIDTVKALLTLEIITPETTPAPPGAPPTTPPTTAVSSLSQISNEAGQKVGVPPRILEAVMKIECGRIFQLPIEKIVEYSQPGNGLPPGHYCFKNYAGAHGPMQFLRSTWRAYANAVNKYGGYTHTPYIENIRDSVYAAAAKLKSDSRAAAPDNWTEAQVKRAAMCYNNSCRRSAYLKALKQSYHDFVWNFYQGRI